MTHLDTEASTGCVAPVSHYCSRGCSRLSVLTLLTVTAACGGKAPAPPPPQPVSTITMRPQPTSLTQEYPAQLEASNTVEIRPQVGGILYRQGAIEGTQVKRGQTLFEIDPQPYIAALAQAQAGLAQAHAAEAQAERDLARARPLTAIDALSQKELDAAVAANASTQGQVKAQEAAVKTAELNLGYTQVRSPIDGVMSRALIRIGGVVTAYTTLLTTVYQTDPMYANFSVGEQRLLQVQRELGRPIDQHNPSQRQFRILLADGSEYELPGTMNFVDAAVDLRTDTLALRLTVPNPKQFLRAGQYVRVVVATRERPNALLRAAARGAAPSGQELCLDSRRLRQGPAARRQNGPAAGQRLGRRGRSQRPATSWSWTVRKSSRPVSPCDSEPLAAPATGQRAP